MIPTAGEIWEEVAGLAPPSLAEEWDNCGLQVGRPDAPVERLMVSLDPSIDTLHRAMDAGASMLLTHHPLIFHPIRSMDLGRHVPGLVARFLQAGVTLYAAHTNLDSSEPGVSSLLAEVLGLLRPLPILPSAPGASTGLGRVGDLPRPMEWEELARMVSQGLGTHRIRVVVGHDGPVERVAVCGGSGGSLLPQVLASGAQLYLTGEIKHSEALEAKAMGLVVIDAGHFATEAVVVGFLADYLKQRAEARGWSLEVVEDRGCSDPLEPWPPKAEA